MVLVAFNMRTARLFRAVMADPPHFRGDGITATAPRPMIAVTLVPVSPADCHLQMVSRATQGGFLEFPCAGNGPAPPEFWSHSPCLGFISGGRFSVLKPSMSATIAICRRVSSLLNRDDFKPPDKERASGPKSKQVLTSIRMLKFTQGAADNLLMVQVEPAAVNSSMPPFGGEGTCAGNSVGPRCHDRRLCTLIGWAAPATGDRAMLAEGSC